MWIVELEKNVWLADWPDVHRHEHENGAVSTIPISGNNEEGSSLIWNLIWVKPVADETRYHAAGVIETFEYMLSGHLTANQACKRLRELRRVRAELCKEINRDDAFTSVATPQEGAER